MQEKPHGIFTLKADLVLSAIGFAGLRRPGMIEQCSVELDQCGMSARIRSTIAPHAQGICRGRYAGGQSFAARASGGISMTMSQIVPIAEEHISSFPCSCRRCCTRK